MQMNSDGDPKSSDIQKPEVNRFAPIVIIGVALILLSTIVALLFLSFPHNTEEDWTAILALIGIEATFVASMVTVTFSVVNLNSQLKSARRLELWKVELACKLEFAKRRLDTPTNSLASPKCTWVKYEYEPRRD
jgi:hypothetical protein